MKLDTLNLISQVCHSLGWRKGARTQVHEQWVLSNNKKMQTKFTLWGENQDRHQGIPPGL